MMRPRFEDPIDTAKDMVDNNITLFEHEYVYPSTKQYLLSLGQDVPEYKIIAENMISIEGRKWTSAVKKYIHESGTHAFMYGYLGYDELQIAPIEKWWKSSEVIPANSYGSFLSSRNWNLNEV